jgi:hypothetical protein
MKTQQRNGLATRFATRSGGRRTGDDSVVTPPEASPDTAVVVAVAGAVAIAEPDFLDLPAGPFWTRWDEAGADAAEWDGTTPLGAKRRARGGEDEDVSGEDEDGGDEEEEKKEEETEEDEDVEDEDEDEEDEDDDFDDDLDDDEDEDEDDEDLGYGNGSHVSRSERA